MSDLLKAVEATKNPNIPELQPGDTVSVERTAATVVVDTIQTFFRVGFAANIPGF